MKKPAFALATALSLGCAALAAAEPVINPPWEPLDPAKTAQVDAALPKEASAQPLKPRRLLISARTEGFYHKSIPLAAYALQALGKRTGAYEADVNNEMSAFDAANLAKYDAVLLLSTTKLKFESEAQRKALLDYIRVEGRGLAGIHAACDNFDTWPEGQALIGGIFHSHPWHAGDTVAVKLDEPNHPLVRAFGGRGFWIKDEIYQIVGPYSRDTQRVVLSLDNPKPENVRPLNQIVRTDFDFPIAWAKREGSGRVFYSSLGHNDEVFWNKNVLRHYLDGLQFVLGDLNVPTDGAKLGAFTPAYAPAQAPLDSLGDKEAKALLSMPEGDEASLVRAVEETLRQSSPAERAAFLALLHQNVASTATGQRAVANLFALFGGAPEVATLERWARGTGSPESAVQALGSIGGGEAIRTLRQLLAKPSAAGRLAVVNALAAAKARDAVPDLLALLNDSEAAVKDAAAGALGRIGSDEAIEGLAARAGTHPEATRNYLSALRARTAELKSGDLNRLQHLAGAGAPYSRAALETLLEKAPAKGLAVALSLLADESEAPRLCIPLLRAASASPALAAQLGGKLAEAPAPVQKSLAEGIEQLATPGLLPVAQVLVASPAEDVRQAALAGLALSATKLDDLAPVWSALESSGTRSAATSALSRVRIQGFDTVVRERAAAAEPARLAPLLTIASSRLDNAIMPLVLKSLRSEVNEVRTAAFRALAPLVRGEDLDTLFDLRDTLKTAAERRAWQDATVNAIRFRNDPDAVVERLSARLPQAESFERSTYTVALVNIGTPAALDAIRGVLASEDVEKRKEVIRALSTVRVMASGQLLIGAAETAKDSSERILALRGFLDVLRANPEYGIDERVAAYKRAWAVAERREEQAAIVAVGPSLWNAEGRQFSEEITAKFRAAKP